MPTREHEPIRRSPRRRYVLPGHWQHVSARTQQGRYAFENFDPEFVARVRGHVGIANARYGVQLAVFVLMGNHFHALIQAKRSRRVSLWCQYVKSNLARLTHEFHGTTGTVWDGPYRHANLLTEYAELANFRYICAHSIKEGLTNHPGAWPGPNCIDALLNGTPIEGIWLDRDGWRAARKRDPKAPKAAFLHKIPVELTPLGAGHRSPQTWRQICRETVNSILVAYGRPDLPATYTSRHDFTHVPEITKKSRAHCFDARVDTDLIDRQLLREAQEARSNAVEASIFAYQRMVERGLDLAEPPHGTQWTSVIANALAEEVAEGPFPGRPFASLPRQAAA